MPIHSPSRMHLSSNNRNIHPSNMLAFPSIDGVGQRRQEVEIICLDLLRRFQQACRYVSTNLVFIDNVDIYDSHTNISVTDAINTFCFSILVFIQEGVHIPGCQLLSPLHH